MDILNNLLDKLPSRDLHRLGFTSIKYDYPVRPRQGEVARFWENNVSHIGLQRNAVDFIIPHPIDSKPLPIYMPADGVLIEVIQSNDVYGNNSSFARFTNQIVAVTSNGEYFRVAHIKKDSCRFSVGDNIKQGTQIAETGVNGWMTDPRHSHFEVGIVVNNLRQTLKVRWTGI